MALRLGSTYKQVLITAVILFMVSEHVPEKSCLLQLARARAGSVMHQLPLFPE